MGGTLSSDGTPAFLSPARKVKGYESLAARR